MAYRPLRSAARRVTLSAGIAAATLLSACGTANRGVESVHQPVVTRTDYVFDVAAGPRGLAPGEARRLDGWMAALRLSYGDTISVDDPYGAGGAVRGDVAGVAAHYGLLLAEQTPVTGAAVTPGSVRVVVSRTRASVPNCPDFSRTYAPNYNAHTSSDYGCSINTNLAAMIANPADLVHGQDTDGYDAAASYRAIDAYRKAAPTGNGGTAVKSDSSGGGK